MDTKQLQQLISELNEQSIDSIEVNININKDQEKFKEVSNRDFYCPSSKISNNEIPWYQIPIGKLDVKDCVSINGKLINNEEILKVKDASDLVSYEIKAKDIIGDNSIAFVSFDGKDYEILEHNPELTYTIINDEIVIHLEDRDRHDSNIIINGYTGSGKTTLIKNIVDHVVKYSGNEIFISDLKGIDYLKYQNVPNIKLMNTFKETNICAYKIYQKIKRRLETMKKLGIDEPITNKSFDISLDYFVSNDICFEVDQDVELVNSESIVTVKARELWDYYDKGYKLVIHTCDNGYKITEDLTPNSVVNEEGNNILRFSEIFLIFDEFMLLNNNLSRDERRQYYDVLDEKLNNILNVSRITGVTVIISSSNISSMTITPFRKQNANILIICGDFDYAYFSMATQNRDIEYRDVEESNIDVLNKIFYSNRYCNSFTFLEACELNK